MPASLGNRLRVQSAAGAIYLLASEPIEPTRLQLQDADTGTVMLLDIAAEPAALRDRYGRSKFGQGCLLARRLVENGVRFIEVESGGWDMHKDQARAMAGQLGNLSDAILALTGHDPGLIMTGTAGAIILAYAVRFFGIAQGAADAAFGRISPSLPMAARSLGLAARFVTGYLYSPARDGNHRGGGATHAWCQASHSWRGTCAAAGLAGRPRCWCWAGRCSLARGTPATRWPQLR